MTKLSSRLSHLRQSLPPWPFQYSGIPSGFQEKSKQKQQLIIALRCGTAIAE
jgi:hypothetical protein